MSKSKIVTGIKRSSGSLTIRKDTNGHAWSARFSVYELLADGRIKARRKSAILGLTTDMTREEAEAAMRRKMKLVRRTYESLAASEVNVTQKWFITNPLVRGAAAELLVSVDLMRAGLQVYRNVNPTGSCDLVVELGQEFVRVEVKIGTLDPTGRPIVETSRQSGKFDVLAVVGPTGSIHYFDLSFSAIHFANHNLTSADLAIWHGRNRASGDIPETPNNRRVNSL